MEDKKNNETNTEQKISQEESGLKKFAVIKIILAAIATITAIFLKSKNDEERKEMPAISRRARSGATHHVQQAAMKG